MSLVSLYNHAISINGAAANIVSPDENSREAALCRTWFTFVRDMVMGAAPWPSLKSYSRLAMVASRSSVEWETGDPAPAFARSFAEPANMLRPRYLQSYNRFEWSNKLIHTDETQPILFFLRREEDISLWDQDLRIAVTYALAAQLSIPLTGRSNRLQENIQIAQLRIDEARSNAANSEHLQESDLPDWLQVRGSDAFLDNRYFYPLTSFNMAGQ